MGVKKEVGADAFPEQGAMLGMRVVVVFNYDTERQFPGAVVRYDITEPNLTIIGLDDGRYVLGTECQFRPE